jgi:hypothetical protein
MVVNTRDGFWHTRLSASYDHGITLLVGTPGALAVDRAGHVLNGIRFAGGVEIRDRMETTVEVSSENSDNFRKHLVTFGARSALHSSSKAVLVYDGLAYFFTGEQRLSGGLSLVPPLE